MSIAEIESVSPSAVQEATATETAGAGQLKSSSSLVLGDRSVEDAAAVRRLHVPDRAFALLLIVLLSPVLLLIALLVKVGSRGPVVYSQERVGLNGQTFRFYKFRTMIPGADALRSEVIGAPDEDVTQRYRNDPRVTGIGNVLRRWSLDELPQLVNVVRGDMAIVGPRPMLVEEVVQLEPRHHMRHLATPGLTGLWQVSGRKETSWEERMDLDLRYVREQSTRLDLDILRRTFGVVLRGDGAY